MGWFRQVLPHEHHVAVEATVPAEEEALAAPEVLHVAAAEKIQRAWLPLKVYPVVSGVRGGLAGGVAMAIIAILYGIVFARSIWYPINLIAGSLYSSGAMPSNQALMQFHPAWLLFAVALHLTVCTLVGLLYGAMLPMLPGRPILWGGVVAPCSGAASSTRYSTSSIRCSTRRSTGIGSPLRRWRSELWQELVVVRHNKQWTTENLPLAMRAGIEAPGLMQERHEGDEGRSKLRAVTAGSLALLLCAALGCELRGKPGQGPEIPNPHAVLDSQVLYNQNCAGCHGADGRKGAAVGIGDPVYLALASDDAMRSVISKGRPGTAMSAFAKR